MERHLDMSSACHPRQQIFDTWTQWNVARVPRLLHDPWPQVLPRTEGGADLASASRSANDAWLAVLAAMDELSQYRDLGTIARRSVELLRQAGVERAAIFLLDVQTEVLMGTFGTGALGETTDERHIAFKLGQSHREAFSLAHERLAHWSRFSDVPLYAQRDDQSVVLRRGENIIIPIQDERQSIGLIACDWALTGQSPDTEALLRAAVFARFLGPLFRRATQLVAQADITTRSNINAVAIARVVKQLQLDPQKTRTELARITGTTSHRIGKLFKTAMGESLQSYRNRIRLERFLAIVDPAGGDLLAAALDAGFGSYAQFHRVFRRVLGRSPLDYLHARQVEGWRAAPDERGSVCSVSALEQVIKRP